MELTQMDQFINALTEGKINFNFPSENMELVRINKVKKPEKKNESVVYHLQKEDGTIIAFAITSFDTAVFFEPETFQNDDDLISIGKLYKLVEHQMDYRFPEIRLGLNFTIILNEEKYKKRIEMIQQDMFPSGPINLQKPNEKSDDC